MTAAGSNEQETSARFGANSARLARACQAGFTVWGDSDQSCASSSRSLTNGAVSPATRFPS